MHRILIREIMTSPAVTIDPEALAVDAAELMEEFGVRRLPVIDEDGCILGIVTDTDVLEAETVGSVLSNYEPNADVEWLAVQDIMTAEVVTISPDATVDQLATELVKHKIGGVPVVEPASSELASKSPPRFRLLGIVTETDIFQLIANAWAQEVAQSA